MTSVTADPKAAPTFRLHVEGMACTSCVERVDKAIRATPGVASASVDLAAKTAVVTCSGSPDPGAVIAAIGKAGYEAVLETT